jgi:hypothetical protein
MKAGIECLNFGAGSPVFVLGRVKSKVAESAIQGELDVTTVKLATSKESS